MELLVRTRDRLRHRLRLGASAPGGIPQLLEGGGPRAVRQEVPDLPCTVERAVGAGVDLDVVAAVGMDAGDLAGGQTGRTVTALLLAPFQFGQGAVHTDQYDVLRDEQVDTVGQAPLFAQDVVHHDVVAAGGHPRDSPMEALPGA